MCAFDEIICDRFFVIGIGDQAAVFGGNSSRYDAARPRKILDRHFSGCLLHVEPPDGCGDFSAGLTVQRAVAVKADPDRGGDVRRITDEPGIFMLIGGPGLACGRSADIRSGSCTVLNNALQHVSQQEGDPFVDDHFFLGYMLLQYFSVAVNHFKNRYRFYPYALIGQNTERAGDIERGDATGQTAQRHSQGDVIVRTAGDKGGDARVFFFFS